MTLNILNSALNIPNTEEKENLPLTHVAISMFYLNV